MNTALILTAAMALDAALGEPQWLWRRCPHPAVLMGRLIGACDKQLNGGTARKLKGGLVVLGLILISGVVGAGLSLLGPIAQIIIVAILVAQKSLVQHVTAVADGLRLSLPQGRRAVAMIVSRDTADMTQAATARSAIESAAENLSDGVIAPALWYLVAGLPGIIIYKLINTADSMIGYRTQRHADFGWAAARLDDLLNWVPARITAALIALPAGALNQFAAIRADAALHRSPNAGWPEAAMARAIDVALAGPRAYDGVMQDFAWVHGIGQKHIGPVEIDAAITRLWQAWAGFLATIFTIGLFLV